MGEIMSETENKIGGMPLTEAKLKAFLSDRKDSTYASIIETFVLEAMGHQRSAEFPVQAEYLNDILTGQRPFAPYVVYDKEDRAWVVFLIGKDAEGGPTGTAITMKAAQVLSMTLGHEKVAGIVINPWNNDGVQYTKDDVMLAVRKVDEWLNRAGERHDAQGDDRQITDNVVFLCKGKRMTPCGQAEEEELWMSSQVTPKRRLGAWVSDFVGWVNKNETEGLEMERKPIRCESVAEDKGCFYDGNGQLIEKAQIDALLERYAQVREEAENDDEEEECPLVEPKFKFYEKGKECIWKPGSKEAMYWQGEKVISEWTKVHFSELYYLKAENAREKWCKGEDGARTTMEAFMAEMIYEVVVRFVPSLEEKDLVDYFKPVTSVEKLVALHEARSRKGSAQQ